MHTALVEPLHSTAFDYLLMLKQPCTVFLESVERVSQTASIKIRTRMTRIELINTDKINRKLRLVKCSCN